MTTTRARLLLALLLTFGLIAAACGGSDDSDDGGGDGADAGGSEEAEVTDDLVDEAVEAATDDEEAGTNAADAGGEEDQVGQGDVNAEGIVPGGEIIYAIDNDGAGFDTTGAIQPGSIRIAAAVVEPLVQLRATGDWGPLLAEDLIPNDDFTIWTIKLRPDVLFHDGVVLDAEAAKANLDAFRFSATTGFVMAAVDDIVVVDDLTLEVQMNSPWSAYPFSLTAQGGWMVSPSNIGTNELMIGTGPFVMGAWTPGDGVRVEKFDDYWRADEGLPYLDAVEFKVVPEQAARHQALVAGDIDAYSSPADAQLLEYLADDSVSVYQSPLGGNEFVIMPNTNNPPLDDVRIRRALVQAVDRDLLIETFRSGLTQKASSFIEPASRWYAEPTGFPDFDLEAATAAVAEYEAENGPAQFTLSMQNRESITEVGEFLISFWEDAGIEVDVRLLEPGTDVPSVLQDDFDAITWFQFNSPDPDGEFVFLHSSGGLLNWSNYQSDAIDDAFTIGRTTDDFDTRYAAYAELQQAWADEMPVLWFDHIVGGEGVVSSSSVAGLNNTTFPDGIEGAGIVGGSFHGFGAIYIVSE
ncbi:MAG: ABC transporter substrate-binding protein [Actinomycetota bacterium]